MTACPFCGAPLGALDCPCRIEAFKRRRGKFDDERAGSHNPMSGRVAQGEDLVLKGVRNEALRRAIERTARG